MDTVSMLNTMSFYCQPILPLVYDESMSYYETLCKVVGQLNNTGETVNKLNEGLTGEIADRQAGDAALDERLKTIEALNGHIHFLVFDRANPSGAMPTRSELYNWVRNGDAIYTLFSTNEAGRGQVYAASCSYNAGNWGSEASNDFNIIVPLETKYDSANDYAVKQKVAKLTIPPISQTSLSVPWGLQIIEINTPYTSAEGVVNVTAVVSDSGSVNCSITPSEFLQLYNMTRGGKNLCVAVNAKLAYDGLARSSSIATVDTTNRIVRIAFERDFGTAITNGVNQLNKTLDYIIGDAKTGTWVHETIDSKIFDFIRYEGFQFTRGAHDVITTDDESTPNAVYAQYHSDTSGKLYQNLPTRLIDTVDGAEYWNGTFDIYGGNHMTFTFVTSNYATASDKMLVRVIELSADVGSTAWKYGVKEFDLPFVGYDLIAVTSTKVTDLGYDASEGAYKFAVTFDASFDSILANLAANKPMKFNVTLPDSTGGFPVSFSTGYVSALNDSDYLFTGTILNYPVVLSIGALGSATVELFGAYLPDPNPDDSDDGKVLTVNKHKWEMKTPTGGESTNAVLYTPQTLTDEQKKQARGNVDAASDFVVNATANIDLTATLDKTWAQINEAVTAGKTPVLVMSYGHNDSFRLQLLDIFTDGTGMVFSNVGRVRAGTMVVTATVRSSGINSYRAAFLLETDLNGVLPQISMASAPTADMQIATKKYVDDNKGSTESVLYTAQTLTASQKLQARKNIDALGSIAPNIQHYMVITPPNQDVGIGVSLSASGAGGDFTLDISDANEDAPTKLTGVKTPTDTDTNAAATVEYVVNKAKKKVWIDVDTEEVKTFNYTDIDNEISNGGSNVWLSLGTEQLRMVACNKAGTSSYELTFVNLSGADLNIHTVTVSASAAEYAVTSK